MMLKYYKFGFGRATDLVSEMIREGRMSRSEGIGIVTKFDGICDDTIIEKYCKYVDISVDTFWDIAKRWVNKDIFDIDTSLRPVKKFQVGFDYYG